MNEHIETLQTLRDCLDSQDCPMAKDFAKVAIKALDWALSVPDSAQAEGHMKILLREADMLETLGEGDWQEEAAAFRAGAAALSIADIRISYIAQLETENARLRGVITAYKELCVAYRLGSHSRADRALTKLQSALKGDNNADV